MATPPLLWLLIMGAGSETLPARGEIMHRLTSELVIYRDISTDSILFKLSDICRRFTEGNSGKDEIITAIYSEINRLLKLSTEYGFDKNLWHDYLSFILATAENPFTLVSERTEAEDGSLNEFALRDLAIFKSLFDYDFSVMERELGINCFSLISNYISSVKNAQIRNVNICNKVRELSLSIERAKNEAEMYRAVTGFYKAYGTGKFGLNKAFRISEDGESGIISPIAATDNVLLDDLVGYELQKKELIDNTEAFVEGRRANNVLLYGDAGTGKSTSIKAVLNKYYSRGLRMIELYKHDFKKLSKVIAEIKNRNYRFIIFMDDLSFEDFEIEYKYLKAVIEGGLEAKPENVLIYATSNKRHLIRETWGDRSDISDDDLHRSDTVQEKLSLAGRFIMIGYYMPLQEEYFKIVRTLAGRYPEITMSEDELRAEAVKWGLHSGNTSGRTAQQFINYLQGRQCH